MKIQNIKYSIPLVLAVVVLVVFRFPDLNSSITACESDFLAIQKIDFDSILQSKSPFFSGLISLGANVFGCNLLFLRILSFVFVTLSIIVVYKFANYFFGLQCGVISASLLTVQNIFIIQSGLVVPDFMLSFFIIIAFYYYFREKYVATFVFLVLGLLTSSITIAVCIFLILVSFLKHITCKNEDIVKPVFLSFFPILIFIVLNLVFYQNIENWDFSSEDYLDKLLKYLYFIFVGQCRSFLLPVVVAAVLTAFIRKEKYSQATQIIFSLLIFVLVLVLFLAFLNYKESFSLPAIAILCIAIGYCIGFLNTDYVYKYLITSILIIIFSIETYYTIMQTKQGLQVNETEIINYQTIQRY